MREPRHIFTVAIYALQIIVRASNEHRWQGLAAMSSVRGLAELTVWMQAVTQVATGILDALP